MKKVIIVFIIVAIVYCLISWLMNVLADQIQVNFYAPLVLSILLGFIGALGGSHVLVPYAVGALVFATNTGLSSGIIKNETSLSTLALVLLVYFVLSTLEAFFGTESIADDLDIDNGYVCFLLVYLIPVITYGILYLAMIIV